MEDNKDSISQEPKKSVTDDSEQKIIQRKQRSSNSVPFSLFLALILGAFLSGLFGAWTYETVMQKKKEIVTLDINKIVAERRDIFIAKYKDKEPSEELRQNMQKDITQFSVELTRFIEKESKKNVILLKDSVISENVRDITEDAKKQLLISN